MNDFSTSVLGSDTELLATTRISENTNNLYFPQNHKYISPKIRIIIHE
jgi:hypothetical protein